MIMIKSLDKFNKTPSLGTTSCPLLWERGLKTFGRTKPSESLQKTKKLNREINKSKLGKIYPGAVKGWPRGSKGRPKGSQGVKGWWAYRVPGVKEKAYRVKGGQGVGLLGPRGSRDAGPTGGSQGVKG